MAGSSSFLEGFNEEEKVEGGYYIWQVPNKHFMINNQANKDKAGKEYWDNMWKDSCIPRRLMQKKGVIDKAINKFIHQFVDEYVEKHKDIRLLEVGCGNSTFLPYMAKEFGVNVFGLDYSENGCKTAQRNLTYFGQKGKIIKGDMFEPPEELIGKFDIVYSAGVIEHFKDTSLCCSALYRFLKPGGICITEIPNTSQDSMIMKLQKIIDKDIYDIHYKLDNDILRTSHESAGFITQYCDYTLASNYGVVAFPSNMNILMKGLKFLLGRWSFLIMHLKHDNLKGNNKTSPYIIYVGVK